MSGAERDRAEMYGSSSAPSDPTSWSAAGRSSDDLLSTTREEDERGRLPCTRARAADRRDAAINGHGSMQLRRDLRPRYESKGRGET
jgi:hypothetical protein